MIESISTPSRRAWSAWPSSWSSSDPKKRIAATTAIATYAPPDRPGFVEGKTDAARDQTNSAKTGIHVQLSPTGTPAMRPSRNVLFMASPPRTVGADRGAPVGGERRPRAGGDGQAARAPFALAGEEPASRSTRRIRHAPR